MNWGLYNQDNLNVHHLRNGFLFFFNFSYIVNFCVVVCDSTITIAQRKGFSHTKISFTPHLIVSKITDYADVHVLLSLLSSAVLSQK